MTCKHKIFWLYHCWCDIDRHTDRQTDRQTDWCDNYCVFVSYIGLRTDRQTDRQTVVIIIVYLSVISAAERVRCTGRRGDLGRPRWDRDRRQRGHDDEQLPGVSTKSHQSAAQQRQRTTHHVRYVTLRYVTLRFVKLRYVTLCYVTFTCHVITSFISDRLGMKFGRIILHANRHRRTESGFWFDM